MARAMREESEKESIMGHVVLGTSGQIMIAWEWTVAPSLLRGRGENTRRLQRRPREMRGDHEVVRTSWREPEREELFTFSLLGRHHS